MRLLTCFAVICLALVSIQCRSEKTAGTAGLSQPSKAWVAFVAASYEARLFAMSGDESMGADPVDFEMHSRAIRESRAELVRLGELVEKEFEFTSLKALIELEDDQPFAEFWEMVEQDFGRGIIQEFLGVGFDHEIMIANQRKGEEFDENAPWKIKMAMPEHLMNTFEEVVEDLQILKN